MKSKSIQDIKDCYGCGLCAIACPRNIIDIKENDKGFNEPIISDEKNCVNCGLCVKVCSFSNGNRLINNSPINTYASWSKNNITRRDCSSGGVAFEIAKYGILNSYKVIGVVYNVEKNRAEHYIASTVGELEEFKGSKYIQSITINALKNINTSERYIFIGTPCQVDSFKRYTLLKHCEKNFVFVDFFCHGVPSIKLWDKYLAFNKKSIGLINRVSWRNKDFGWHDSWNMLLEGENGVHTQRWTQGDLFYELYLGNHCLGPQCYDSCRFKSDNSSADIRIGDLWGTKYKDNVDGVSGVVTFTKIGDDIIQNIDCVTEKISYDTLFEGQINKTVKRSPQYTLVSKMLTDKSTTIDEIYNAVSRSQRYHKLIDFIKHPSVFIKRIKSFLR